MNESITKTKILEMIRNERESLEALLGQLSEEQMTYPGLENNWSVKDVLAHIAHWERRMVGWIEESLRGEVPQRPAPGVPWDDLDGLNEQVYLSNLDKTLGEVLADFHSSYQQSLKVVEALTEEDLTDSQRFEWRRGDPMWHMIAANTCWHYQEHAEAINNWLKK